MDPKSLVPDHLRDDTSAADLKEEVKASLAEVDAPKDDAKIRAMRAESYTFAFDFVAGNGRRYSGSLAHKIPDLGQRQAIGALRGKLGGGIPYEVLDPFTRELNMIVADLTFTLDDKDRPEWAQNLRSLKDASVIYRVWEVAAEHEATFLGPRSSSA